ncbi:MAG: T9SS type A sorting domain-containing protein [Chitinophagaceae bacterium]|nr:T9SS type A sorting domain-containing protein [Chitinophagaceae bacterium]MBP6416533.1 T9SS type A sorting domain-containing protein [Chitinophagaceae bacterium]
MRNATASTGIPVGCAAGGTHYDVWFQFTAVSTSHTVTISSLQSNFTNPEIQLFSGTCGTLTSLVCGTTTMTGTGLTIGNTYYVRVSNIGTSISSNDRFDICITHPPAIPANDNCANATSLTSGTSCSNTSSNIYYASSSSPAGTCGGATASTTYDVWFRFQATSTTQTVRLSNLGSRLSTASTYMEMLSGACGSLTSLACQNSATRMTVGGLTIGNFYYVRVYVVLNPTGGSSGDWDFDICVQQPPANDECTGAITLTSGVTCSNTAGTLDLATANAATPLGCFVAGTYYDVWYSFTATAVSHTVSLSSTGSSFTAPRIQMYRGTCAALISMGTCSSTTTLTQAGLIIGTTYYIRVANFNTNPSGTGSVANFNICVTAVAAPPSNDLCTGAIMLTSSTTCSNISGTLIRATATAGLPACGNSSSPEVWYSFVAQSAYPTITLSSIGANLNTRGPRIQLFSGTCGSLTSLACTTNPLNVTTALGGAGLTIGDTYYIRITTNTNFASPTSGTYTFNICVTDPAGALVDYAKSYINVTDGTVGGTINTGDVLEIRATLVVQRNGSPIAHRAIDSIGFYDTLAAGKGYALIPNSISLRTNEGKIYKSFTDIFDSDAGWYTTAGPGTDTTIQINIGAGATNTSRGKLRSNSPPSFYSNTCIIMATYRVTVNAGLGTPINFGGGAFRYRDSTTGVYYTINFPNDSLIISEDLGLCPNTVSTSNILGDEFNGTFGEPTGSPAYPQNRGTSPNTNYAYSTFAAGSPQDYFYGIANNTSAAGTTVQTVAKGNAARVHTVWDISGDHTGAANTARGNNPCNLSAPISSTNPCGYMLVVNAAYRTDLAFNFSVSGACPNTYYEISGWFKNVCYKCGCDSLGRGATSGSVLYIPTAPGDSSGVRPNIAFQINGIDHYTTGDILYQGLGGTQTGSDTLNNWVKRGFVYKTGPSETSFTLTLRNNAPGGGGNDWALDDLSLRTCLPNMTYSPTNNPAVCENNVIEISDTIRSYFNTYTEYKWQRSTDGGVNWTDIPGTTATATPVWNGTAYEFITTYTIPLAWTTAANSGDLYRVVVASTTGNLASSTCSFSDPTNITLNVLTDCVPILGADLLSVSGKLIDDKARITWVTSKEQDPVRYSVERSDDGIRFTSIAIVDGYNNGVSERNYYTYDDPQPVAGKVLYRIAVLHNQSVKKYSQTITLSLDKINTWEMGAVINPFNHQLQYGISSPTSAIAKIELIDNYGKTIRSASQLVNPGSNAFILNNTGGIPAGIYLLKVTINGTVAIRKVMKGYR